MKKYRFFFPLIVAYCGCATAAEQSDKIGSTKLPENAVLMYAQHVVGDASGNAMHIEWQAFGFNDDIDNIVQFYQEQFSQPPAREDTGRYVWRFKKALGELVYSLQPSLAAGPWSKCSLRPPGFENILLISNATSAKEP